MQQHESMHNISVTWRGRNFILEMNSSATLKELGQQLQKLTDVKADTMRLIVPQSSDRTSKLLSPFSNEHSALSLQEASFLEGRSIRMMGVPEVEINEVLQNAKSGLRIAGFDEEEKRLRQRMLDRPHTSRKLPQGNYIFCDFRTLHIPGIELTPPASEALKRMHMLAADPGIIAIMNKHRWRVGIMTEMAPVGYVGVSPKCILGYNKNHGEEISLRLRTDDLKGFRKYESIKKTLLHELAHMVYSEHDANFYNLDKQLNQEAASLDWTRSKGRTLSSVRHSERYAEEFYVNNSGNLSQKLGGNTTDQLANARASSVSAAYRRLANTSMNIPATSTVHEEPDPDDSEFVPHEQPDHMDFIGKLSDEPDPDDGHSSQKMFERDPDDTEGGDAMESEHFSESIETRISLEPDPDDIEMTQRKSAITKTSDEPDPDDLEDSFEYGFLVESDPNYSRAVQKVDGRIQCKKILDEPDPDDSEFVPHEQPDHMDVIGKLSDEPDPDDGHSSQKMFEQDPDDTEGGDAMESEHFSESIETRISLEPDPDDIEMTQRKSAITKTSDEPDPDDLEVSFKYGFLVESDPNYSRSVQKVDGRIQHKKILDEPDPDDCEAEQKKLEYKNISRLDQDVIRVNNTIQNQSRGYKEPDPDDSQANGVPKGEPDPDENLVPGQGISRIQINEPDLDDQELQRIQDPVAVVCSRLQKAIEMLQSEVHPSEAATVLQTLFKIIRNVIENPDEMKFKRLRKANPIIQRHVANYKAAVEILSLVGFTEDIVLDGIGKAETYLVLKRNDPGLLWLAKSSLETCVAY